MKKSVFFRTVLSLCSAMFILGTFLYSISESSNLVCVQIQVRVKDSAACRFVTPRLVKKFLQSQVAELSGVRADSVNLHKVETALSLMPGISRSCVYLLGNGTLCVDIWQRYPLFRIIDSKGKSCYVDSRGTCFALNSNYAANVIVVTGNLPHPPKCLGRGGGCLSRGAWENFWPKLFDLLNYINSDDLWQNLFCQVYVENLNHVELVPRVGGQLILLGTIDDFVYKLNKLWSFYRADLSFGERDRYTMIDLAYGNQVVCARRI